MIGRKVLISGFVIACFLFSPPAFADSSFSWNTQDYGGTGDWSDPDHWNPKGSVPGGLDQSNTFVTISAPTSGLEASEVNLSGDFSINSLSIGPRISPLPVSIVGENSLNVGGGSYLTFLGSEANPNPRISNAGIIRLRGVLGTGPGEVDGTEITGAGKIQMLGDGRISGHFQNRQSIEGRGSINLFMSNQGTIRATDGYVLKLFASTYNEGGVLTTDGWTNGETSSELFIGADVEKGGIDANGARVRFVTSGPIRDVTLTGGQMVFEYPAPRFSGAVKINPDVVLSSTTGTGVGNLELQLLDKTTLENNGVVRFAAGAEGALTVPDQSPSEGSNATLTGTGRVVLKSVDSTSYVKGLEVDPNSWLVHEVGHTIEGSGSVLGGSITNKGRIVARDGTLRVAAAVANSGNLEASPGGILELTGGTIFKVSGNPCTLSPGGGIIRLTGATVASGEWGPGSVEFYYSFNATQASPSVTLSGNNHFSAATVVDFVQYSSGVYSGTAVIAGAGTLTNDGTIRMTGPAALYSGLLNSPASAALLTGSGQLILAPGTYSPSLRDDGSCTHGFINDTNHTIRGAGNFYTPVENRGTVIVENGYLAVSQPLTGSGNIQVKDSGILSLTKDIQAGHLQMDASATLQNNYFDKTIELSGNFSFAQTDESKWNRGMPVIKMNGRQGIQLLEIGSADLKLTWDAFNSNTNFRLKKLSVEGSGTWVSLVDAIDNGNRSPVEVLYASELHVNPGATLNLNGKTLYTVCAGSLHRVAAGEGSLFGGGAIIDKPTILPGAIKGDLNSDALVDLTDAILALQVHAGIAPPVVWVNYAASGADVNGDGEIGLAEAIYILQSAAGMR